MFNNTYTSTSELSLTSIVGDSSAIEEAFDVNKHNQDVIQMTVQEAGHIFSVELRRQKIRTELKDLFQFKTSHKELDFLGENQDLRELLPGIGLLLKNQLQIDSKFCLELLDEDKDWQTLFINIPINQITDLQAANQVVDTFFDRMFEYYPEVIEKLNIDFIQNAI